MRFRFIAAALAAVAVAGCTVRPPASPRDLVQQALAPAAPAGAGGIAGGAVAGGAATGGTAAGEVPAGLPDSVAGVYHWDGARQKLYPMVLSSQDTPSSDTAPLLSLPLLERAVISFVVDLPDRYIFTTAAELERWQISPGEFVQAAVTNLQALSGEPRTVRDPASGAEYWVYERGDGFDAARILLVEQWKSRASRSGGRLIIAIPARDVLYAFTDQNPQLVEQMRRLTEAEFGRRQYPITTDWFEVKPESGLSLYEG